MQEKPQLRVELAVHQYQAEDVSLAQAAHLAGLSYDSMKDILVQRGVQLRLGPASDAELADEVSVLERLLNKKT
jgi:predicted HTH domain antitoxin